MKNKQITIDEILNKESSKPKVRIIKNCKDLNSKLTIGSEFVLINETKEHYLFEIEKRLYCKLNKSCCEVVKE